MRRHYLFPVLLVVTIVLAFVSGHWRMKNGRFSVGPIAVFETNQPARDPKTKAILTEARDQLIQNSTSSLALCNQALELGRGRDPLLVADALFCLGQVRQRQDRQYAALALYEEALDIYRRLGDLPNAGDTLHGMGTVFTLLGQSELARDLFEEALDDRHPDWKRSLTLMEIATLWDLGGQHDLAISNLREAFKLGTLSSYRSESLRIQRKAAILDRLGSACSNAGEFAQAELAHQSARRLFESLEDHFNVAITAGNLGLVHLRRCKSESAAERRLCDVDRALAHFRLALSQLEEDSLQNRAAFLFRLAQALRFKGELEAATEALLEAIQIVESIRAGIWNSLLRTYFLAHHALIYDELVATLVERHRQDPNGGFALKALAIADRLQARNLLESLQETHDKAAEHPALIAELNQLEHQRLLLDHRQTPFEVFAEIERKQRVLLLELAGEQPQSPRPPSSPLHLEDLEVAIPHLEEHTLLLVFTIGQEASFLWRLTSSSIEVFELPGDAMIEEQVRRAHTWLSLSDQGKDPEDGQGALRWLSRELLGPIASSLENQRLLIAHDGPLELLPFAVLRNPLTDRELVLDHEIVRIPSLSLSASFQHRRKLTPDSGTDGKQLVIFGDPAYGRSTAPSASATSSTPARLKFSRLEAQSILHYIAPGTSKSYLGFDATRDAILAGAFEGHRIVHLSTHAEVNEDRPELSQLILSLVDPQGRSLDGHLFVHELDDLKLGACELVVLSACGTALGKRIRGESLVGMTRAVLAAGAQRALVSLWGVDDEATASLMDHFYRALLVEEHSPPLALAMAQKKIRADPRWEAPYYWAAFVIVGN